MSRLVWLERAPPLLWLLFGLAAGDLYAFRYPVVLPNTSKAALAVIGTLLLFTGPLGRSVTLCILGALIGALRAQAVYRPSFAPEHVAHLARGDRHFVQGRVSQAWLGDTQQGALVLEVEAVRRQGLWLPATGRIRVRVQQATQRWLPGQPVRAFLKLRRPRNFGNPREFDYVAHLARQGIYVTAFLPSDRDIEKLTLPEPIPVSFLDRWRNEIAGLFARAHNPAAAAILTALILGDQSGIDPEIRKAFTRAGVSHVLSISGLHVSLVGGTSYLLWRLLLARSQTLLLRANVPQLALLLALLPVLLYAALAGGQIPIRRSVGMLAAVTCALAVKRLTQPYLVLATAAFAVILTIPGATADISFQLSFAAVAILIAANARFQSLWPPPTPTETRAFSRRAFTFLRSAAAAFFLALCAGIGTAPWTSWHFQQASLISPLANMLTVPLLGSVAVILGLASAFLLPISAGVASWLSWLAEHVVSFGYTLVRACAALPFAFVRLPTPTALELVASHLALATLLAGRRGVRRAAAIAAAAVGGLALCLRSITALPDESLEFRFASVGQADATLVRFPDGRTWLVDAGGMPGAFDTGERVIGPVLWGLGHRRLDYLVLTHPQYDHYGGMPFLLEAFVPRFFLTNGQESEAKTFRQLQEKLVEHGTHQLALWRGCTFESGGVRVFILSPAPKSTLASPNDNSLVLLFEYAGRRIILPGDIEAGAERALVEEYGEDLRADVLKAPHHGSRTSSSVPFVTATRPALVVFSVGFQNRFHFPNNRVIGRYASAGSQLVRTDWDGMITVQIAPSGTLRWRTHTGPWRDWQVEPLQQHPPFPWPRHLPSQQSFVDWRCAQG